MSLLLAKGPLGVFIGMVFESLGLPVPSEVLLPFAGWLVFMRRLTFVDALTLSVLAQVVGSTIGYGIGRFGGRPALGVLERLTGRRELALAERWFSRWGPAAVFWGRFLPVVRTFISWPAGLARMHLGRFLILTFLGSIPWTAGLIYLGARLGPGWSQAGGPFHAVSTVLVALLALLLLWWLVRRLSARTGEGRP